jgi:hypothetical protein
LTRRGVLGLSIGGVTTLLLSSGSRAGDHVERADLNAIFQENGVVGTFAFYDVAGKRLTLVKPQRAQTRVVPASTFKIATASSRSKPAAANLGPQERPAHHTFG